MESKVTFKNSLGLHLAGILSIPSRNKGLPVVISCHGFGSGKNSRTNKLLTEQLDNLGIVSFRFDFMGHYDSQGQIKDVTISQGVDDLKSAFQYLEPIEQLDMSRVGLFATSYGGNVALWFCADHNKVKAIALKAPIADYASVRRVQLGDEGIAKWKKQGFIFVEGGDGMIKTNYSFYEDASSRDTYQVAKSLKTHCLIVHGDRDENVPILQSIKLIEALGGFGHLEIMENAEHNFNQPGQLERVITVSVDFLKTYLFSNQ